MTEDALRYALEIQKVCLDIALKKLAISQDEIVRLRSELASERATHQELWQMVDRELDRIYCEQKVIEQ